MKVVKLSILVAALTVALAAPSFAQTPPQTAPKPQTPPATAPQVPAAQPPAPKLQPQPPAPFPQDSKIAFVDIQQIASTSSAGKEASKKLQEFQSKKLSELQDKNKQVTALTTKRDQSGSVLNDTARAQLDKDIEKLQRDIQFAQSNAQAELQDLNNELQGEFQKKLVPIIDDIAKEKGLYVVFTTDSGVAFLHPGLNISDEVIKRLDTGAVKKN
ncbi:MAG TPA: OmpH family outer membrane protein [Vicinamibacterales bacterium]|nr:OmpH family outer membrane protein [Vicinamibacterales bacterium]